VCHFGKARLFESGGKIRGVNLDSVGDFDVDERKKDTAHVKTHQITSGNIGIRLGTRPMKSQTRCPVPEKGRKRTVHPGGVGRKSGHEIVRGGGLQQMYSISANQ